jgi:hypothetical protein
MRLTCAVLGDAGESAGSHVLQQREVGRERFIAATLSSASLSRLHPLEQPLAVRENEASIRAKTYSYSSTGSAFG